MLRKIILILLPIFTLLAVSHAREAQAKTSAELGPNNVWSFKEGDLGEEIYKKCDGNGGFSAWGSSTKKLGINEQRAQASFIQCITSQMQKAGASPSAIAFTKQMNGEVYMGQFREMGKVDLATTVEPTLMDPNDEAFILVNGTPRIVSLWENVEKIDLTRDPLYHSIRQQYPDIMLWFHHGFIEMQNLVQGGQRFIFDFQLLNGCHACDIAGSAEIAFDFDAGGQFLGTKLVCLKEPSASGACSAAPIQTVSPTPPIPYEDSGACPFECCTYRRWIATKDTAIRRDRNENSPTLFNVNKGEWVSALTGVVITTVPGKARVLRPTTINGITAKNGEIVYLLTYQGEGVYEIWYKGKKWEPYPDMSSLEIMQKPESIWWVKIKNSKGQVGWSKEPDNFANRDRCGEDIVESPPVSEHNPSLHLTASALGKTAKEGEELKLNVLGYDIEVEVDFFATSQDLKTLTVSRETAPSPLTAESLDYSWQVRSEGRTVSTGNNASFHYKFKPGTYEVQVYAVDKRYPFKTSALAITPPTMAAKVMVTVQYKKQVASDKPSLPSLHITASALGNTWRNQDIYLYVPWSDFEPIGIEVNFVATSQDLRPLSAIRETIPQPMKTEPFDFSWQVDDGQPSSGFDANFKTKLFSRGAAYTVKLCANDTKLKTSTLSSTLSCIYSSQIKVTVLKKNDWNCLGRMGSNCGDKKLTKDFPYSPTLIVSLCAPTTLSAPYPQQSCDGDSTFCVSALASVGAIKHDRCCQKNEKGFFCGGEAKGIGCELEWAHAVIDFQFQENFLNKNNDIKSTALFTYTWKYNFNVSESKTDWWRDMLTTADDFVIGYDVEGLKFINSLQNNSKVLIVHDNLRYFSGDEFEGAPLCSGENEVLTLNSPMNVNGCFVFPEGLLSDKMLIKSVHVCRNNRGKSKTLVTPQGNINSIDNKIAPIAKSKVKKDTPAGCNKGSNVLSPSMGGAEGALKKYGAGIDRCAQ